VKDFSFFYDPKRLKKKQSLPLQPLQIETTISEPPLKEEEKEDEERVIIIDIL
jgi:hypothetical protein